MSGKNVQELEEIRTASVIPDSPRMILRRGKVRRLIGALLRNNPIQFLYGRSKRRFDGKSYLNIGCGGNIFKTFINIDQSWRPRQDLCWNILKGLPFASNSQNGIFVEHTLEHFRMREIQEILLPEFLRVLIPGGTIRISVPDAEKAVELYNRAKTNGMVNSRFVQTETGDLTPMMYLNNTFRQLYAPLESGHKFAFDYQTLEYFLITVGFVYIRRETYMHGRDDHLLVDYKRRADESFYAEASKLITNAAP